MVELVIDRDPDTVPAGEIGDALRACVVARSRLDAHEAALLTRLRRTDTDRADGAVSAADWLVRNCGIGRRDAQAGERLAHRLAARPEIRDALATGAITSGAARLLAAARHDHPELLAAAPDRPVDHLAADLATADRAAETDLDHLTRQHTRRRLIRYRSDDDLNVTRVDLDDENHTIVTTAIDTIVDELWRTKRDTTPTDPSQSIEQLRADALVELARRSTGNGNAAGRTKPAIVVTVDAADLDHGALPDGQPLPPETLDRLTCDAVVHTLLVDATSQPLWLGRSTRTATPALRLALETRDRGCRYPGCDAPTTWCEAHHLRHWKQGGPTTPDNLVLICTRHHRLIHDHHWELRGPPHDLTAVPPPRARAPAS